MNNSPQLDPNMVYTGAPCIDHSNEVDCSVLSGYDINKTPTFTIFQIPPQGSGPRSVRVGDLLVGSKFRFWDDSELQVVLQHNVTDLTISFCAFGCNPRKECWQRVGQNAYVFPEPVREFIIERSVDE
jgi:hypothetical protein